MAARACSRSDSGSSSTATRAHSSRRRPPSPRSAAQRPARSRPGRSRQGRAAGTDAVEGRATPSSSRRSGARRPARRGSRRQYLEGVDVLGDVLDGFRPARGDGSACSSTTSSSSRSGASPTRSCADGTATRARRRTPVHRHLAGGEAQLRLGRDAWPRIPRGTSWKHGVCDAFGWPHAEQADIGAGLAADPRPGRGYGDLGRPCSAASRLIDFVTTPGGAPAAEREPRPGHPAGERSAQVEKPPSDVMSCPVIPRPSGETRNRTSRATSSGAPRRSAGARGRRRWRRPSTPCRRARG